MKISYINWENKYPNGLMGCYKNKITVDRHHANKVTYINYGKRSIKIAFKILKPRGLY